MHIYECEYIYKISIYIYIKIYNEYVCKQYSTLYPRLATKPFTECIPPKSQQFQEHKVLKYKHYKTHDVTPK